MTKKIKTTKKINKKILISALVLLGLGGFGVYKLFTTEGVFSNVPMFSSEKIVAKIDGQAITLSEVEKAKNSIPNLANVPLKDIYREFVSKYAENKAVLIHAQNSGLKNEKHVQEMLKNAEEQILLKLYLERKIEERLDPQIIRKIYDAEIKNFQPIKEVHAAHILLADEKQADEVWARLNKGEDFALLADELSLDKNAKGGDLGYFTEQMMIPEFSEVVFNAPVGQYTKPFKSQFGWHIAKVFDKRDTTPPTLEEVLPQIKEFYASQILPEVIMEDAKTSKIEILDLE